MIFIVIILIKKPDMIGLFLKKKYRGVILCHLRYDIISSNLIYKEVKYGKRKFLF